MRLSLEPDVKKPIVKITLSYTTFLSLTKYVASNAVFGADFRSAIRFVLSHQVPKIISL